MSPEEAATELERRRWVVAAPTIAAIADGTAVGVDIEGSAIALVRLGGDYFAVGDICPHQSARLSGGEVVGDYIECPAHYALFDIRTGKASGGLACRDLVTYPVRVDGDTLLVGLPHSP